MTRESSGVPGSSGEWGLLIRPIQGDGKVLWLEFMRAMSSATRYKRHD